MQKSFRQIIWSREMLLVAGFYAAFAIFYFLAINWSSGVRSGDSYYQYQVFMDYPLKAFELHAVDYLLKPYTRERFEAAIAHLNKRLHQPQQAVLQLTQAMVDEKDKNAYPGKILVAKGNKLVAVSVADIQYISAEGDYSGLITAGQRFLSQYGIGQIEIKLNPQLFLRIHRSTIININFVKEVFREGHTYDVWMQNGDVVKVSRSYAPKVKEIIF